ncbi:hypothetical protein ACFFLZ_01900 [Photobacterium aphoticum]|uniref:Membrane protein n=1 Tax=Photobacterium aphoticum TaxID=754436 RepID=A0A090RKL2_9GAMM|nr:hypothetical protein [Photobacterium aphoticum]KLV02915.1 membrane protein [Photobacterium aphoticum]PSU54762.1 hypothetical protein C9I90_19155 [Photobacterium aphoticum]GAL07997.1 hypothetical protein JCM19237_6769 [Photobacterium aphoticum]GHA61874.1 hypothetical protein GCM10007086_39500 [Photobacterium aphoticum]
MLTQMDRLTIYAVLCFITFCTLLLRAPEDTSLITLGGLIAAALGLWLELTQSAELEEEEP